MRTRELALAALLWAPHARASDPNPPEASTATVKIPGGDGGDKGAIPEVDLSRCEPALDARRLLLVEYGGRRLRNSADIERLPGRGHKMLAFQVLSQLCSRRPTPVQELAKFFRAPVTLTIEEGCPTAADPASWYEDMSRHVSFRDSYDCTPDAMAILYHELAHAVVADHLTRGQSVWERVPLCFTEAHDASIYDPDDHTLMNAMDARTHRLRALDEGFADGVALAFAPKSGYMARVLHQFRLETRSETWRQRSWARKQTNEFFVALVVAGYLGEGQREAVPRFNRLVAAGDRRQPGILQDLLEAAADLDPVEARGRIDAVLGELNAGWDSEREEVRRAGRDGR